MNYKKKNKFFTADIELSEAEIQSIIGVFEENMHLRQMPYDKMMGLRKEIYDGLKEILSN